MISYVLAGGVLAAVIGPELAKLSVDFFEPVKFAGCYAAFVIVVLISISVLQFIEISRAGHQDRRDTGRPVIEIARQPKFIVAVMSSMIGYGVMALVMTATPLAMVACGHKFNDTAFVIQWRILGMFAPSFFTGNLIGRFGATKIIMAGVFLMVASISTALSGISVVQFWGALVCLGLGWNFMFIGGTTLLTETYVPADRAKTQALHNFLVFFDRRGERLFIRSDSAHAGLGVGQYRHDTADVPGGNRANLAAFRDQTANRDLLKG